MNLGLTGCAAFVSGASSGLGLATARALAAEGCSVALFARRRDRLEEEARQIESDFPGVRALALPGDFVERVAIEDAMIEATTAFGRLDVLVNNTGKPASGGFDDLDDDDWARGYELVFLPALRATRVALPALRASGRGRIVNITSSLVKEPSPDLLLSSSLRPGIIGWAKALSRVEAESGITVNSVAPGFIATERLRSHYAGGDRAAARQQEESRIPLRRFGTSEEVGATVTYLCSVQASYITGATILVDGGLGRGLLG